MVLFKSFTIFNYVGQAQSYDFESLKRELLGKEEFWKVVSKNLVNTKS